MSQELLLKVSRKTGVPVEHLVGPLPAGSYPVTADGLYVRQSARTGDIVYSMVRRGSGKWGLYSDTIAGAKRRAHKSNRKTPPLLWFGVTEDYHKANA